MNLKTLHRLTHPEACYACKWAGRDVVIWPQEPKMINGVPTSVWWFYAKVRDNPPLGPGPRIGNGHRQAVFCAFHWKNVFIAWCEVAKYEIELYEREMAYLDRIENHDYDPD